MEDLVRKLFVALEEDGGGSIVLHREGVLYAVSMNGISSQPCPTIEEAMIGALSHWEQVKPLLHKKSANRK